MFPCYLLFIRGTSNLYLSVIRIIRVRYYHYYYYHYAVYMSIDPTRFGRSRASSLRCLVRDNENILRFESRTRSRRIIKKKNISHFPSAPRPGGTTRRPEREHV